ncbi:hypothetical protein Thena_1649 [Thermodesulfobium narugense DSM 14796]|uniref:Cytoplasmic protein n=1 Tax=Thermodesulfobium narugense DSM 14796 TaxID=747365 RepID=M1E9G9_9BACT|nr:DUF5320 domain-containing protein [Thermodesulfobium narugense]AEE15259.1 hypothetical protein Thena_1649 [Thermodesulfobium narugense DSM 14796]
MPRGDGTGPLGLGPMTGRGLGYCSGNTLPGFVAAGYGIGRRFFGRGRRFFGRGFGWFGWPIFNAYNNPEAEKSILQNQLSALENTIEAIKNRLNAIEKEKE